MENEFKAAAGAEEMIRNAESLLRLGEREKARAVLEKTAENFPSDWRAWFSLVQYHTMGFTDFSDAVHAEYLQKARLAADESALMLIDAQYGRYLLAKDAWQARIKAEAGQRRAWEQEVERQYIENLRISEEKRLKWEAGRPKRKKMFKVSAIAAGAVLVALAIFLNVWFGTAENRYAGANTYTVTYTYTDGSGAERTEKASFVYGRTEPVLAAPERAGYEHTYYTDRFFASPQTKFDPSVRPEEREFRLYGRWEPVTYTIRYENLQGGSHPNTAQRYTVESETIVFNPPVRSGLLVGSWDVLSIPKASTGDKVITAQWRPLTFKTASSGLFHSLAVDEHDRLWAWGDNSKGQLGNGATATENRPVRIMVGSGIKAVSAGIYHSMVIDASGDLWAWGNNESGRLGDGTTMDRRSPVWIQAGTKFKSVSAGGYHTLAIDGDDNLWAWGENTEGRLGDGTAINRHNPVRIKSGTKFKAVSAGGAGSLAIDEHGGLWAWGNPYYIPTQIKPDTKFIAASCGSGHNLALDESGGLWSWGANESGQLGDGTTASRSGSSPVLTRSGIRAISAGGSSSFALDEAGGLWAWGYNWSSELGDGTMTYRSTAVAIKSDTKFGMIFAGNGYSSQGSGRSLAIDERGELWTWGLGDSFPGGHNLNRTPVKVS